MKQDTELRSEPKGNKEQTETFDYEGIKLTKDKIEIIEFWRIRGYDNLTHCLGMNIHLHLKDKYITNGLDLIYLEQFRDKIIEEQKKLHSQDIQKIENAHKIKYTELLSKRYDFENQLKEKDKDLISLKFQKCELHNKLEPILQIKGEYEKEIEKLKKKLKGGKR